MAAVYPTVAVLTSSLVVVGAVVIVLVVRSAVVFPLVVCALALYT